MVEIQIERECQRCKGTGNYPLHLPNGICDYCGGTGKVVIDKFELSSIEDTLSNLTDKVDDVLDKCDDILEKVS